MGYFLKATTTIRIYVWRKASIKPSKNSLIFNYFMRTH